eukprot:scaffold1781_cov416-Prasinococcus_capsulatus_cf.AAC.12
MFETCGIVKAACTRVSRFRSLPADQVVGIDTHRLPSREAMPNPALMQAVLPPMLHENDNRCLSCSIVAFSSADANLSSMSSTHMGDADHTTLGHTCVPGATACRYECSRAPRLSWPTQSSVFQHFWAPVLVATAADMTERDAHSLHTGNAASCHVMNEDPQRLQSVLVNDPGTALAESWRSDTVPVSLVDHKLPVGVYERSWERCRLASLAGDELVLARLHAQVATPRRGHAAAAARSERVTNRPDPWPRPLEPTSEIRS